MELVLIKLTSLGGIPAAEIVQAAHSKAVVIARLQVIPIALFLILTSYSNQKIPTLIVQYLVLAQLTIAVGTDSS